MKRQPNNTAGNSGSGGDESDAARAAEIEARIRALHSRPNVPQPAQARGVDENKDGDLLARIERLKSAGSQAPGVEKAASEQQLADRIKALGVSSRPAADAVAKRTPASDEELADRLERIAGKNVDHVRSEAASSSQPYFIPEDTRTETEQADELLQRAMEAHRLTEMSVEASLERRFHQFKAGLGAQADNSESAPPPTTGHAKDARVQPLRPGNFRSLDVDDDQVHAILQQSIEEARLERQLLGSAGASGLDDSDDYLPEEFLRSLLQASPAPRGANPEPAGPAPVLPRGAVSKSKLSSEVDALLKQSRQMLAEHRATDLGAGRGGDKGSDRDDDDDDDDDDATTDEDASEDEDAM